MGRTLGRGGHGFAGERTQTGARKELLTDQNRNSTWRSSHWPVDFSDQAPANKF